MIFLLVTIHLLTYPRNIKDKNDIKKNLNFQNRRTVFFERKEIVFTWIILFEKWKGNDIYLRQLIWCACIKDVKVGGEFSSPHIGKFRIIKISNIYVNQKWSQIGFWQDLHIYFSFSPMKNRQLKFFLWMNIYVTPTPPSPSKQNE